MVWRFAEKSIYCSMLWALAMSGALFAADVCELTFSGCPETFNNQTITVPDNVVKLSSLVHACKASTTLHIPGTGGTSSILFVIDNTGSMRGNNGNDPTGARFTVVRDLLDTIMAKQPDAEVGLVVFREHLFFDTTTTQYYTQYFKAFHPVMDSEPDQAYLPFMVLNQNYNGKTGITIIKDILTTNSSGGDLVYQPLYRNLRPNPTGGETNINGALIAAKQVALSAKNPKDHQFVVFLSDGEPTGHWQAGYDSLWFSTTAGVANLPATFTVFFNRQGNQPASLTTMTNNIKINGYSSANPESNIWALSGVNYSTLMSLLMTNVIQNILVGGNPTKMILNGKTSTMYIDSSFYFTDSFPLTNALTSISMGITYRYVNPQTNILSDTIVQINFNIQKSAGAPLPPGISEICTPGIPGSVPVTATLLDTSGDGHLDRIDLTWTDTSAIKPSMPSVAEFIKTLEITTLDGKKVTLTAVSIQLDPNSKTIHIILQENTGPTLETGWQNANVTLTTVPMTVAGGPFYVIKVVDGAAPVIKSICFDPTSTGDELHVTFSERVDSLNPPLDPNTVFTLYTRNGNGKFTFTSANPKNIIKNKDNFVYVFTAGTLTSLDSLVEGNRPAFHLSLCGGVSIVKDSRVIGNPFVPGQTLVPVNGPTDLHVGTRIEVSLVPAIVANLMNDKITGTMSIFDAVGNTVADNLKMLKDDVNVKVYWFWDGKTKKGSMAAPGTYLARIVITDLTQGKKQNIHMNIGIKSAPK